MKRIRGTLYRWGWHMMRQGWPGWLCVGADMRAGWRASWRADEALRKVGVRG